MISDWRTVPLGNVVTFQRGYDLPERARREGSVPVVSSAGVTDSHDAAMVEPPGVVTGRYGTIGEVFLVNAAFWPLNTTLYVRDFHGNDPRFVYYLLQRFDFNTFSGKSGVPGVNRNELHREAVDLPARSEEQRAIAEALGDVDALLVGLDRRIAKKRDLKQAAMQQLLTGRTRLPGFKGDWDLRLIGNIAECRTGGTPSTRVAGFWGGPIRWMSSGELNLKRVHDVSGRITEAGLKSCNAAMLVAKCVLIGLAGQGKTRGTVALNMVPVCTNQSIAAVLPNPGFVPEYLYYNLDSRYEELRELSSGGGGRGGLTLTAIQRIPVPLPSLSEQAAIAEVLSDIDAEMEALEARREKTRSLKQAMMQELLTGKTRLV